MSFNSQNRYKPLKTYLDSFCLKIMPTFTSQLKTLLSLRNYSSSSITQKKISLSMNEYTVILKPKVKDKNEEEEQTLSALLSLGLMINNLESSVRIIIIFKKLTTSFSKLG